MLNLWEQVFIEQRIGYEPEADYAYLTHPGVMISRAGNIGKAVDRSKGGPPKPRFCSYRV